MPGTEASNQSQTSAPMHSKRPSSLLLGAALAAVLLIWSVNYIAGKIALQYIDGLTLAVFRSEIVAAMLGAIYFAHRERMPLRRRDIWTFVYLGFFGYAVNQCGFVIGLGHTTSDHSAVIIAAGPIVILLLASMMRLERLSIAKIVGMAICFVGVVVLETENGSPGHSPFLLGDFISLLGVIGFSVYTVLGKRVARAYDSVSMNTFNAAAAAIMVLPIAIRQGIHFQWKAVPWQGWAGLLYMAALSAVAGYLLFYWLLRHMEASRVVAINYFQPVVVVLISIPLLGERPTGHLIVSTVLVLVGVFLAERSSG
jgi:drug/metabolite transporter (DMT)-like permease